MTSTDASSLVHPAYRHLDRTVRLAGLSLGQWIQLVVAGVAAWLLARVLPFGTTYDLSIAVTVAGVPVAATFAARTGQASPFAVVTGVVRWRRQAAVYTPSTDDGAMAGYVLAAPATSSEGGRR